MLNEIRMLDSKHYDTIKADVNKDPKVCNFADLQKELKQAVDLQNKKENASNNNETGPKENSVPAE